MTRGARAHLEAYLGLVTVYLKRYLARHGHRLVQADGALSDLFVSLTEAQRHLGLVDRDVAPGALRVPGVPDAAALDDELAARRDTIASWVDGRVDVSERLPLEELRAAYRLSEGELELLVAAAAPALSIDLARLYTFAWADFSVKQPTVGFLLELCALEGGDALAFDGALVRHGLVHLGPHPAWAQTPAIHATVVVPDAVVRLLSGRQPARPDLVGLRAISEGDERVDQPLVVPSAVVSEVERVLRFAQRAADRRPVLGLLGRPRSGRRSLVRRELARIGVGLVVVDLAVMPDEPRALGDALTLIGREAMLRGAALLLRGEEVLDDAERLRRSGDGVRRFVASYPGLVIVTASRVVPDLPRVLPGMHDVELAPASRDAQIEAWQTCLTQSGCAFDARLAHDMAARTNLPIGAIVDAVDEAAARLARNGARRRDLHLDASLVGRALQRRAQGVLAELAEPFSTTLTWDDVVLPEHTRRLLDEIVAHARLRDQVYDGWGFRRILSYSRGLSCLFSGPPGTGKTMMAALVAQSLGRELYRVDLSRITSKWIGETMKSLGRIFAEAEQANVILLFDEADSLFAKRTQVNTSNDRFANMEVNYLLQKMESFDGMAILTTNFDEALDVAFRRRIRFRVEFRIPDQAERTALWRAMIPAGVPLARDVDFDELGRRYQMSGGSIKNALLRSAFHAAGADAPLAQAHLRTAAEAEAREMGMLVRG